MAPFDLTLDYRCPKTLDDLEGAGNRRHCAECRHDVTLLHEMTAEEARAFLRTVDRRRRTCVAYLLDDAGKPLFRPERVPSRSTGMEVLLATALSALIPLGAVGMVIAEMVDETVAPSSESTIVLDEDRGAHLRPPPTGIGSPRTPALGPPDRLRTPLDDWTYVGDDTWLQEKARSALTPGELELIQKRRNIRTGIETNDMAVETKRRRRPEPPIPIIGILDVSE